jgi:hypothetical protein
MLFPVARCSSHSITADPYGHAHSQHPEIKPQANAHGPGSREAYARCSLDLGNRHLGPWPLASSLCLCIRQAGRSIAAACTFVSIGANPVLRSRSLDTLAGRCSRSDCVRERMKSCHLTVLRCSVLLLLLLRVLMSYRDRRCCMFVGYKRWSSAGAPASESQYCRDERHHLAL